jgi:hypothetical protein
VKGFRFGGFSGEFGAAGMDWNCNPPPEEAERNRGEPLGFSLVLAVSWKTCLTLRPEIYSMKIIYYFLSKRYDVESFDSDIFLYMKVGRFYLSLSTSI